MNKAQKIVAGLLILQPHTGFSITAAHDEIHAGCDELPAESKRDLISLGWREHPEGWWSIFT